MSAFVSRPLPGYAIPGPFDCVGVFYGHSLAQAAMMRLFAVVLLVCAAPLLPLTVRAQSVSAQVLSVLTVQIRDVDGQVLQGMGVAVRGGDGAVIVSAVTDAVGRATFFDLRAAAVRVTVTGQLPSGQALYLPGQDAEGIAVFLQGGPTALDLRVDRDGMVSPDPATMTALDAPVPIATAPFPAVSPTSTWRAPVLSPTVLPAGQPTVTQVVETTNGPWLFWFQLIIVVMFGGTGVLIFLVQRRGGWR